MCQLAAYVGDRPIAPLLLRALELQEPYVGGHATGLAVIDEGSIKIEKDFGHIARVKSTTNITLLKGTTGIAHSRYNSTARDDPRYNTKQMAHPFLDDKETIALTHNGTITNFKEYWSRLRESHNFRSYVKELDTITDSEIAVHLLSDAVDKGLSIEEGLRKVASQITGSFLLACISRKQPETIWIANWYQPCVVALGEDEAMFCSSYIGFHDVMEDFDKIFEPPKNSLLKLTRGKIDVQPLDPNRRIPNLILDRNEMGRQILSKLGKSELDFMRLRYGLRPEGYAKAYGISAEEFEEYKKAGINIVNPLIEVLDMLIAEKKILEKIDLRLEGGVRDTPRFSYSLF